jgi:thymidylate synthase (FAD)
MTGVKGQTVWWDSRITVLAESSQINSVLFPAVEDSVCEMGRIVATAGKTCYNARSGGRPVDEHIRNLVLQKHYSVLEHVSVTFLIQGISRGCSHELVRHRHLSFSQRSTRYVEPTFKKLLDGGFGIPSSENPLILGVEYLKHTEASFNLYEKLVEELVEVFKVAYPDMSPTDIRKRARGSARQVLPTCLATEIVVTGNFRTWREVLLLRTSRYAEPEIRRLFSNLWFEYFYDERFSDFFCDFHAEIVEDFVELTLKP